MQAPQVGLDTELQGRTQSKYERADLATESTAGRRFRWKRGLASSKREAKEVVEQAEVTSTVRALQLDDMGGSDSDVALSRFRPGALTPVAEEARGKRGKVRSGRVRAFDKALLAAEIICALVVSWLVIQYIYTVYFDTAPHRLTATKQNATTHPAQAAVVYSPTPTTAPTYTVSPIRLAGEVPEESGDIQAGSGNVAGGRGYSKSTRSLPVTDTLMPAPTNTATATATPTVEPALLLPVRLRIPTMFLDSPVEEVHVNMGTWQVSAMIVGHNEGSANPGEVGNMVLAAHRDINSALFRELDRLKPGDEVFVSNSLREYKYVVEDSFIVSPSHTEVMDPTDDKRLTLLTCTPIGLATQRLVVTAKLDEPAR